MRCNGYTSAARRDQVRGLYFQWEGFGEGVCVRTCVCMCVCERERDNREIQGAALWRMDRNVSDRDGNG